MPTLAELDPRCVIPNPHNPRFELPDLQDLTDSIKAVGVLQPIVVFPVTPPSEALSSGWEVPSYASGCDQLHMILIGHRRHAAVLELGLATIPCIIAETEAIAEQLVKILAEAGQGVDLTLLEEASAFHQLELLDWTPERIATATARPLTRVRSALSVHHLPAQARTVAARVAESGDLDLDLEQIAALEEFAGDPKVMARITRQADNGPWGFRHAIAEEQTKRDRRQQLERVRAELTLAGVRIVPRPQAWGYGAREAEASTLLDAEGQHLDPEQVKARPGFAAFIDTQNLTAEPRAVIICVDPEAWGYTRTLRTSYVPDDKKAAAETEARHAAERKKALATASTVRRAFLAATYGTARAAKRVYLDALRDAVRDPDTIRVNSTHEDLAAALAGSAFTDTTAAGIDRLTRILVARWLTAAETNLDSCAQQRWNSQPTTARDYLDRLTAAGYTLSEAEQSLYDDLLAEIAEEAEENDDNEAEEQDSDEPAEEISSVDPQSADQDSGDEPATGSSTSDEPASDEHPHTEPDVEVNEDSRTELNSTDASQLAASA